MNREVCWGNKLFVAVSKLEQNPSVFGIRYEFGSLSKVNTRMRKSVLKRRRIESGTGYSSASLSPALCPRPSSCPPWAADGARWEVKVLLELPLVFSLGAFGACFLTCWDLWGGNTNNWFRKFERGDGWEIKRQLFSKQRFWSVIRLQCITRARAHFAGG